MENWKQTKVFITGAAGFIGANLARHLLQMGCEVHVLLRPQSRTWRLDDILSELNCHAGDLTNKEELSQLVRATRPEYVWHLATYGAYPFQTDARNILETNILGTCNLLTACENLEHLQRLVYMGSSSEYGKKSGAMREDMLLDPATLYGIAKATATMLCVYFHKEKKLPTTVLRPFSVFGPYEEPGRLFPDVVTALLRGQSPRLANPDATRDFVYVDDVLDALLLAAQAPKVIGEVCNVSSGKETSIRQIFEIAKRVTASSIHAAFGTAAPRVYDASMWVGDATKAVEVLGWEPKHTLENGISKTIAWYREHLDFYPT